MQTEVDIANMALARIGKKAITGFDDHTDSTANLCRQFYPYSRDEVLSAFNWSCAKTRAALAAEALPVNPFDTKFSYLLPNNPAVLRVIHLYSAGEDGGNQRLDVEWKIEGNRLLTDVENIGMLYIGRVEDATKLTRPVAEVISLNLARKLCTSVAGAMPLLQAITAEYSMQMMNAQMIDGLLAQEQTHLPRSKPERRQWWDTL